MVDPMAWVMEGFTPVTAYSEYLLDLKLKNHSAMESLVKGRCTPGEMNKLLAMNNAVVALVSLGFGAEFDDVASDGYAALDAVCRRAIESGRFVCRAAEIKALNLYMELHDAQMATITVADMERAITIANAKKLPRLFHKEIRLDPPQQHREPT